jgi:signal transduction histidine kinase/DNA-binding response OmpR family regulator
MKNSTQANLSGKTIHTMPFLSSGILFLSLFYSMDCYSQDSDVIIGTAPWWRSWWALSLDLLIFVTFLFLVRRYELNRIRLKNQLKLEKIESETLRNMDQVKSRFFANISHEFRTPLSLILGQVDSVMSSGIGSGEKAKLQVAERNARRLLELINQILDLSKLEAGSMKLNLSQHNIVSFLKGLFYSFESLAAYKNISLFFHSDTDKILAVFDPDKMEKIFNNLVSNAVKFTDAHGKIKISLHSIDPQLVEFRVENNGHGIPADQLSNIFNRFYQVSDNTTRDHEGTGIGLSLVKELVELHHGTISAERIEGTGMVFIVRLPVLEFIPGKAPIVDLVVNHELSSALHSLNELIDEEIPDAAPARLSIASREIILIVEDNIELREFIRGQIEDCYLVIEAKDGKTGLSAAQAAIPDLIITDLMMPVMDGYQFCKKIRNDARTSHIPIIMLTARAGFEDKMEGLETGIDDFITKPFSTRELKVRILNLINQRNLLRARFSLATIIKPSEVTAVSIDKLFLEKIVMAIEANFENQDFNIKSLAAEVNMSASQLNRKLNALVGQSAGQLVRSIRLQRAAELLQKNAGTISEVCYQLGFNDQAYFSRAFKKQFGRSPGEYSKVR